MSGEAGEQVVSTAAAEKYVRPVLGPMSADPLSLVGKVALVTGAGTGIGRAITLLLANRGAHVVIHSNSSGVAADALGREIREVGGSALLVTADLTNADEANALIPAVLSACGQIDILVNNAGITRDNMLLLMSEEEWDTVFATNVKSAFLLTKAALRSMMRKRSGVIINIASVSGLLGTAGQANYAASKAALISFTKTTAREMVGRGIRANVVAPGLIDTVIWDKTPVNKVKEAVALVPMATFGTPDDVAQAVAFLASEAARYFTGQVLVPDGGLTMFA